MIHKQVRDGRRCGPPIARQRRPPFELQNKEQDEEDGKEQKEKEEEEEDEEEEEEEEEEDSAEAGRADGSSRRDDATDGRKKTSRHWPARRSGLITRRLIGSDEAIERPATRPGHTRRARASVGH